MARAPARHAGGRGFESVGIEFDGTHIWLTSIGSDSLLKLRASDGARVGTYLVGENPEHLVFDGTHIWVSSRKRWIPDKYSGTVMRLRASDGAVIGTYPVGNYPRDLAFDGAHIWVSNHDDHTVSKICAVPQ
jgi:DNA-binding beta-propeller fold protein YncE